MSDVRKILEEGLRLHRAGRLAEAAAAYAKVFAVQPGHADALHLLGLIRQQQGDHAAAAGLFARAIKAHPRVAMYHLHHGVSLRALGRTDEAMAAFRAATERQADLAEAHHQLGNALKSVFRYAEAIASLQTAARLAPGNATILLNLGVACLEDGQVGDAVRSFRAAVRLQPAVSEAQNILGHALLVQGHLAEARQCFDEALRLRPEYAPAHNNLARLLKAQGRLAEAVVRYRAALAAQPDAATHSNLLLALNFLPGISPAEVFAEHRRWAERWAAPLRAAWQPQAVDFTPGRRLRIGYVSADFESHAVTFFFEPVLVAHDRENFETFCYSDVRTPDRVTQRLRAQADHWRDIAGAGDDQVAALVRADRIDILVDLAGHTAHNRLLVFARKPAPVQVTWIGYPNTTGLEAIDYRLTEAVSDPIDQTDAWHSEKLARLPETFSCYRPPDDSPPVAPLPAPVAGHVTFGCFNNFAKVTPPVIELWARLLRELPDSRLLFKSRGLADAETVAGIREEFGRRGVAPERIDCNGEELSVAAHLRLYHGIDIALDPFPYNGTTTTCEALWMGVPVVTLAGRVHAARVGASLLTHLGAVDWVATTPGEYAARALALARDLAGLATLRAGLRERMRASPLCDAARFTRHLERTFREMWTRRCESRQP